MSAAEQNPVNPPLAETPAVDWLVRGGEMSELIRRFNWANTPLGPAARWPQSLRTAVNLMLDAQQPMWIGWRSHMTFLYNDAYLPVLSLAKHPWALGRAAAEVWAEIWDVCGPLAAQVFEQGEASCVDDQRLFMRRGDFLEETFYSFSYSPIRGESGDVCGLFCPSSDVTAKNLNARRLATLSQLAARALVEKTTEAACAAAAEILARNRDDLPFFLLYLIDDDGLQATLCEASGLEPGDFTPARLPLDATAPAQLANAPWPVAEVVRSAQMQWGPIPHPGVSTLGPAGVPVTRAIALPLIAGEQRPLGVLIAGINPTRILDPEYSTFFTLAATQLTAAISSARAYQQERRRAEALAELDRAKTAFFANVSHEFRTPLTLMLGPLQDALQETESPAQRERLQLMQRNTLRLQKLVNNLLDFSRLEAGRMQARYRPTDLALATADLASGFRSMIEKAGLRLKVNCAALAQPVHVDHSMWEKIVFNLLSNAFKFTQEGEIEVSLIDAGDAVELAVRDTGAGIAVEHLPHIFERFHRVEEAQARSHEGTGIGLALVRELVKLHGGTVIVESMPGRGSTFTVRIPIGCAHLPAQRIETALEAAAPPDSAANRLPEWMPDDAADLSLEELPAAADLATVPRIVWADDNADMRAYVRRLLARHYRVETVADGHAALAAIRRELPDLVLSDIMMPRPDGRGLLRALRDDERTRTLPVILLSARAGEEARVQGLRFGADDYLVKPFSARELLARIEGALKLAQNRRQERARDQFLLHLERALRPLDDANAITACCARLLGEHLKANRCAYALIEPDQDHFTVTGDYAHGVAHMSGRQSLDAYGAGAARQLRAGQVFLVDDVECDARIGAALLPLYRAMEIAAVVCVPLHKDGQFIAGMALHQATPRQWTAAEIELLNLVSNRCWESLERAQATQTLRDSEGRLRESEQKFAIAFRSTPLAQLITARDDGRVIEVNDSMVALSGYSAQEMIGRTTEEIGMWMDPQLYAERYAALRAGQDIPQKEVQFQAKDGWILTGIVASAQVEIGGRACVLSSVVDITTRKHIEGQLQESEQRYRSLFESVPVAVFVCDRNAQLQHYNLHAARLWGREPKCGDGGERHCGSTRLFLPDGSLLPHEQSPIVAVIRTGMPVENIEVMIERPDGSRIPVVVNFSALKNRRGEVTGAITSFYDISARKQAETAALEQAAQFQGLFDDSPTGTYLVDSDFRIARVNPEALPMFGDIDHLIGRGFGEVIRRIWGREIGDEIAQRFRHTLDTGEPYHVPEFSGVRQDRTGAGREYYEWQIHRIPLVDGSSHGVVCYFNDISAHVLARQALADSDRRKDEFLATLSHELRNPLAPIRNSLEIMKRSTDNPAVLTQVRTTMERQVAQLIRLVDDLLDVSRISKDKLLLQKDRIDLGLVIQSAVESTRPLIESCGHELTVALPREAVYVDGDLTRLAQVFVNLLNNSAKYTPKNGRIWLTAEVQSAEIMVSIKDTGLGIPQDMLPEIFEMFTQVDRSLEKTQGGLGIGLTLVRRLVHMHGGTVTAHSDGVGCGSVFIVRLPLFEEPTANPLPRPAARREETAQPRRRILVVDDNHDAATSLTMLLQLTGNEVHTAYDGLEAVELAGQHHPEIVLMDLGMPRLNGYDAARRIRKLADGDKMILVALTGWGQEDDKRKSAEAGFNAHMTKPVDSVALMKLMATLSAQGSRH